MTIYEPGTVIPVENRGYLVASRSTPGAWWLVDHDGCSCPANVQRCWHIKQVAAHVAAINARLRRPTASPNVRAMVD